MPYTYYFIIAMVWTMFMTSHTDYNIFYFYIT